MRHPTILRTRRCLAVLAGSVVLWSALGPPAAGAATPTATATATASAAVPATPAKPPAAKPAARAVKPPRAAKAAAVPPPPLVLPEADSVQIDAAERVYYGNYDCEFNQSITLHSSPKYVAYVDLTHGKTSYLMKPVLSSTGAIRLEDVLGATLMVQISNKSMLLDVKGGKRLVDDCVSPKQRELIEAARQAKAEAAREAAAAEAAKTAATAASAPAN